MECFAVLGGVVGNSDWVSFSDMDSDKSLGEIQYDSLALFPDSFTLFSLFLAHFGFLLSS